MKRTALLAAAAMVAAASFAEPYTRLFRIHNPVGDCQVRRPGAANYEPAVRNKAYPFGTSVRCGAESSAVLLFSEADAVRLLSGAAATVDIEGGGEGARVVSLHSGEALTRIGANTAEDYLVVDTPAGRARSLAGNCRISVSHVAATKAAPASTDVELRAEASSSMKFIGRQYIIPALRNGFGARISSAPDDSATVITDTLGDYTVLINTGNEPDPAGPYEDNAELGGIKLNTKAAIRLWREKAAVGGATVVAVLVTTPSGKGRESFAFAVGKADVAARSNVFIDTITNEMAIAEAAKAAGAAQGGEDDGAGLDQGGQEDFGADGGDSAPAADDSGDDSGSMFDFL
ncbi:MAG: hypothetical protein IJP66_00940, partial [Kiritimatiellae bacterium]|nr:hypothetical protein [Kiritimatiellia bacterium]